MTLRVSFSRRSAARALYVVAGLGLATAVVAASAPSATAATTDGSDWGPSGAITSSSAQTVAWDGGGNAADDTVPRDATQILPYTNGANYTQTDAKYTASVKKYFGGMKITVSQTTGLVHQGVQVSYTGVSGGSTDSASGSYLDVFQCWGGPTVSGAPATVDGVTDDSEPDPTHCETGVGGVDNANANNFNVKTGTDKKLIGAGDVKSVPTTTLTTVDDAATKKVTLTATLSVLRSVATGAAGSVEFDTQGGTVLAKGVAVKNGIATLTIPAPTGGGTYTAAYTATPTENYASSPTSAAVSAPVAWDVGGYSSGTPGSVSSLVFPAGTFSAGKPITESLDGKAPIGVGSSDTFGAFSTDYTIPSGLVASSSYHTLTVSDGTHKKQVTFQVPFPPIAGPGLGTDSNPNQASSIPFQSVNGAWANAGQVFSTATTNEFADFPAGANVDSTVSRTFEVQTGAESAGLGCGATQNAPSTSTCWLVAVPYPPSAANNNAGVSPLSPSLWANRVQVKLGFADVVQGCNGSQARTLSAGTELLGTALASWIPAICSSDKVGVSYATVGDRVSRSQYAQGNENLVFTSAPIDDQTSGTSTVYAPVALTGVTIGYRFYDATTGKDVTGVKLDARLVARLLTESYAASIDTLPGTQVSTDAPWSSNLTANLLSDPEFKKLNPGFPYDDVIPIGSSDLVVSSTLSDPVDTLWRWIMNDPDAKAFLDGCDGTINPWYSTRTYAECPAEKTVLEATAKKERDETVTPTDFDRTAVPVYPPTQLTFPQPGWYARTASGTGQNLVLPLSLANIHPQESDLATVSSDVFQGLEPSNGAWCPASSPDCAPIPPGQTGKWSSSAIKSLSNGLLGVTDTSSSSSDLLSTASLCDDDGHCVGADTASLTQAASSVLAASSTGADVLTEPATAGAHIADGAYPLTMAVYAEVNTKGLSAEDASPIAKILSFITSAGQKPGYGPGELPPGYAPLTTAMVTQAKSTIATLDSITDPAASSGTATGAGSTSSDDLGGGSAAGDDFGADSSGEVPSSNQVPVGSDAAAAHASSASGSVANPTLVAAIGKTPATPIGFPRFGVWTGLGGAVAAGVAAPIVGRRRKGGL